MDRKTAATLDAMKQAIALHAQAQWQGDKPAELIAELIQSAMVARLTGDLDAARKHIRHARAILRSVGL